MSLLASVKELMPYGWRKNLLDMVQPQRPGIGPILRGMDRSLSVVFDIGANVGDVSRYMLHYFPAATVYGFEPCSSTYERLLHNVDQAGFKERFRPFRLGFFDAETTGTLQVASAHGANSLLTANDEYLAVNPHISAVDTEEIPLARLDDFVARQGISHIDLVKIDVEGVELQVLRGGADTFAHKVDTLILEVSFVRTARNNGEYLRLFQLLHGYGFAPAQIFDLSHSENASNWKLAQFDCVFRKY